MYNWGVAGSHKIIKHRCGWHGSPINRKTHKCTKEDIARAVRAVKECKMSQLLAAKKFNVPWMTIMDHMHGHS